MENNMIYRKLPSTGDELSILGFGCMRLPRIGGLIDETRAERLILSAIDRGINYFDAAYLYFGSESALGKILHSSGKRNNVKISTKLPAMLVRKSQDIENYFNKQIERLKSEYIDYYLLHNLSTYADFQRLREMGFDDFISRERERGRIRGAGFSFHGNLNEFKRIIDSYPWAMCIIQFNYLDERFQAGIDGLNYASERGVGVVCMEPLRGGTLGNLPGDARKLFDDCMRNAGEKRAEGTEAVAPPSGSPAELAFRWVWSHSNVTSALSGMNMPKHVEENCRSVYALNLPPAAPTDTHASADVILGESDKKAVAAIKAYYSKNLRIPCTSCAYCLPCPVGVDIPTCFSWYNIRGMKGGVGPKMQYAVATEGAINGSPSRASLCVSCGECEAKCPQKIKIRDFLKETAREMESGVLLAPIKFGLKFIGRKSAKRE